MSRRKRQNQNSSPDSSDDSPPVAKKRPFGGLLDTSEPNCILEAIVNKDHSRLQELLRSVDRECAAAVEELNDALWYVIGPAVTQSTKKKVHALDMASRVELAGELLKAGADPDCRVSVADSHPPLTVSVQRQELELTRVLLRHGANPNDQGQISSVGQSCVSPLHQAAVNMDIEAIKLLIEAGADKNKIYLTRTPLMYAIGRGETGEMGDEEFNLIDMLITEDNVNMVNDLGESVLHTAAFHGAYKVTKIILDCPKIDLEIREIDGCTPLKCCFWSLVWMEDDETMDDAIQCAQLLLDAGSDINVYGEYGCSCLCDIIKRERVNPSEREKVIEFLIKNGIDINGQHPLHKHSPLFHLEDTVHPSITRLFIQLNVDVHQKYNASRQTPLELAIIANNVESVVMFLLAGARFRKPYNLLPMLTELQTMNTDFDHRLVCMLEGATTDIDIDQEMLKKAGTFFNNLISQPPPLKTIACWATRASMASGQNFKDKLNRSLLPQSLKDFLSFKYFDDFLLPLPRRDGLFDFYDDY